MHPTAMMNCADFFSCYGPSIQRRSPNPKVVEIGSQDVNGSLRSCIPKNFEYTGVDFVDGKGVDIVITDPYKIPFADASTDVVVTSSCFEHSEFFWLLFLEIIRILRPHGLLYLNAPSNGDFHRWPVDCWRFYPDSGRALARWGNRNGYTCEMLESYTSQQYGDQWNDFVAVFLRDANNLQDYPDRILNSKNGIFNGLINSSDTFHNHRSLPEDRVKLVTIHRIITNDRSGSARSDSLFLELIK